MMICNFDASKQKNVMPSKLEYQNRVPVLWALVDPSVKRVQLTVCSSEPYLEMERGVQIASELSETPLVLKSKIP